MANWENQFYEKFGECIKNKREKVNLKQQDVADMVGISQSYLSSIENGERKIPFDRAVKLCDALNLDMDFVLLFIKTKKPRIIRPILPTISIVDSESKDPGSGSGKL